ncbi:MAG: PqqD family protein [Clostridia bacterium]|nr:PqqD family protein [Clostridia bacterium]
MIKCGVAVMFKIKDGFIVRRIGPQTMAVPTGKMTSEIHGMIALSESAVCLWSALEKGAEAHELAKLLTDQYETDYDTALADVEKFIEGLREQGALE